LDAASCLHVTVGGVSQEARRLLSRFRQLEAALVVALLVFVVAAGTAIGQLVWSARIRAFNGCGFDGYFYCAMLKGTVVPKPFNRRILLPFLAKQVDTNGLAGFWVVNLLSLVAATLLAMYVAWRLRPLAGAQAPVAYRVVPPLLVGAAFLSARNTFHLIATYPALTDPLGLLLLVGAVALVVCPVLPSTRLLLIPVCFLAPLAREQLAVVLVLALLLAGAMRLLPWLQTLAAAGATVAGGAFALHQPHKGVSQCVKNELVVVPCPQSIGSTFRFFVDVDFGSWSGFFRFGVMLLLALGPFVFLVGTFHAKAWRSRFALWIVGVAAIFTAVSILGGGDTDRIVTPAGLLLALALVISVGRSPTALLGLVFVFVAYFVQQEPFRAVSGESTAWLAFYGLRVTALRSVVDNGLAPTLIALPLVLVSLLLLSRASRAAD
jgi:hypothetical protein